MYWWIKHLHQLTALLSISGFMLRAMWMMTGNGLLRHPLTRTLPHINDTVFLAAAVWLAITLELNPLTTPWLAAKLAGLLVYIGLGSMALRPGRRSRRPRIVAAVLAVAVFGWIVSVALTRSPLGFWSQPGG